MNNSKKYNYEITFQLWKISFIKEKIFSYYFFSWIQQTYRSLQKLTVNANRNKKLNATNYKLPKLPVTTGIAK